MGCFDTFIGINTDCPTGLSTPTSGLYINDLPGINLITAGDVADEEYANGYALLAQIISFSNKEAQADFGSKVANYFRTLPFSDIGFVGDFRNREDGSDYLATSNENRGVDICTYRSSMSKINISDIELLTNTTINGKTLTIADGTDLTTYSVDLVAGQITTVEVDKVFDRNSVWVYWNTSDIAVNDSRLYQENCTSCGGSKWSGFKDFNHAYVRGRTATETKKQQTYGIRVNFNVSCDQEALLCAVRNRLKMAFLYKAGIGFCNEWLASDRFNAITNLNKEIAVDLRDMWEDKYDQLLDTFARNARGIMQGVDDDCVICKGSKVVSGRV